MFFQVAGGALGGTLLRIALGTKLANEIHNASCWIEPEGEVDVWQAVLIEFTSAFILLYVTFLVFIRVDHIQRLFTSGSWVTDWGLTPVKQKYLA